MSVPKPSPVVTKNNFVKEQLILSLGIIESREFSHLTEIILLSLWRLNCPHDVISLVFSLIALGKGEKNWLEITDEDLSKRVRTDQKTDRAGNLTKSGLRKYVQRLRKKLIDWQTREKLVLIQCEPGGKNKKGYQPSKYRLRIFSFVEEICFLLQERDRTDAGEAAKIGAIDDTITKWREAQSNSIALIERYRRSGASAERFKKLLFTYAGRLSDYQLTTEEREEVMSKLGEILSETQTREAIFVPINTEYMINTHASGQIEPLKPEIKVDNFVHLDFETPLTKLTWKHHGTMTQRNLKAVDLTGDISLASFLFDLAFHCSPNLPSVVLLNQGSNLLKRKWVFEAEREGFLVRSFSADYRTAVLEYPEGLGTIQVKSLPDAWFDVPESSGVEAFQVFEELKRDWRHKAHMPLLGSASLTGLFFLEQNLPRGAEYASVTGQVEEVIREATTQARIELFCADSDLEQWDYLSVYDGVWMYAACCYLEMPCGLPVHDDLKFIEPMKPGYYRPGWYKVRFTVPKNWHHVGLLPVKIDGRWRWPDEPGSEWEGWISEPEIRLAIKHGWQIEVKERLLFTSGRPLENWKRKLGDLRELAGDGADNRRVRPFLQKAYRRILIDALGAMYAKGFRREQSCTAAEWAKIAPTLAEDVRFAAKAVGGNVHYTVNAAKDEKAMRFYMPQWASYTWARARVRLAEQLLQVQKSELIGCYLDAAYLMTDPGWQLSGRPGSFRKKHELKEVYQLPRSIEEMTALSERAGEL